MRYYKKKADNKGHADINSLEKYLSDVDSDHFLKYIHITARSFRGYYGFSIVLVFLSAAACTCDPDHITL